MARKVIGLIGNIGAGKSTLGAFLTSDRGRRILEDAVPGSNLRYFHETVDECAKELFYQDREQFSDALEVIQARLRVLRHTVAFSHTGLAMFDRTLIEGSETFRRNSFEDGYLTHQANEEYDRIVKQATDRLGRSAEKQPRWLETLLVYLRVEDPELLQQRQTRRGDAKEGVIPISYLRSVNERYEKFVGEIVQTYGRWGLRAPEILFLDGTRDIHAEPGVLEEHTERIAETIRGSLSLAAAASPRNA